MKKTRPDEDRPMRGRRNDEFMKQQQLHAISGSEHGQHAGIQGKPQHQTGMHQQQQQGTQHQNGKDMQIQALSQKNHRLAKELSDLRVRHREETSVVSRLTMENMNLATRCRDAIAQVASLKKELAIYQQRQSNLSGEYDGLKREIGLLKKQMSGNTVGKNHILGHDVTTNNIGSTGEDLETLQQRTLSPTTDLDRIMSLQKFGGNKRPSDSSINKNSPDKTKTKDSISTVAVVSTNSKIPISIAPNNSSASNSNQKEDEFDADIDMVDFFTKQSEITTETQRQQPSIKSLHHHVRKTKSNTDDVMPDDMIGTGLGFSPEKEAKKAGPNGDSLLSSLDAFEASFASAFPETSFSIKSEPTKETEMDMTFDVPDFGGDPFFNNFRTTSTPHTMVFDSTPISFDDMSANNSTSKGKINHKTSKSRSALTPLSPQSMSAEIEQLDAIANLSGSGDSSSRITRKMRNVKQPVSYAEPSTKSKLRRGDVIFPKVDAQMKLGQNMTSDKTTAKVLKDLEQTSNMVANIDIGKDSKE